MFGLPGGVAACLFDMDGLVTRTAAAHPAARKDIGKDIQPDGSAR